MINIVIVNWNGGALIEECLESLRQVRKAANFFDITVVDNASSDQSPAYLSQQRDISFLENVRNEGFGRACNQGAEQGTSEFILFLNPDTRVESDVFSTLLSFMQAEENARIAVCGIKLVDGTGHVARSCARFPTLLALVMHSLGLDRLRRIQSSGVIMSDWDHLDTRFVDHVIGAFYLIRRSVFERLSGFDEDYFVYFEDLDLSRRVSGIGYRTVYLADIKAQHIGGGTTDKIRAMRTFLSRRGRYLYARKHFSQFGFLCHLPFALVCEPLVRISASIFSKNLHAAEERKAANLFWRWFIFHRQNRRWIP